MSVGKTFDAFVIAWGSYTLTWAPARLSAPATANAGESRTSSDSGLNAAPSTVTRASCKEPPHASFTILTSFSRRRRLIASTSRRKVNAWSAPNSPARAINARMSFGRQPPPNPSPALRNFRPIRSSAPIASASTVISAPDASHTSDTALMKLIFVARKAFAETFTSSDVAKSVTNNGVPSAKGCA